MAVITQTEARVFLPGVSADDSTVATLISRADSICAAWCGFPAPTEATRPTFDTTSYTRYLTGPGGRDLQLPVWPIVSVTSIEDDATEAFAGTTYIVASGDYAAFRRGVVRLKQTSTHGAWSDTDLQSIKAVWTAGWTAASAPENLKNAVCAMVALLWQTKFTLGVSSIGAGDNSTQPVMPVMPDHIKQMLAPFRLLGAWGQIP